jgi:hypothetical protein
MKKMTSVTMLVAVIATALMAQIPTQGLVAYFPFTGSSLSDESGSGIQLSGFPTTNPPVPAADRYNATSSAYEWSNATGRCLKGSDSLLPMGSSDRTICVWVKSGNSGNRTLLSYGKKEAGKMVKIYFAPDLSGNYTALKISNYQDSLSTNGLDASGGPVPILSNYTHITVVITGTTTIIYINGVENTRGTMNWNTEPYKLYIGATEGGSSISYMYPFWGRLDDIAVYNKALTPGQITKIFQSTTKKNSVPQITSTPTLTAETGKPYSYTVTYQDADVGDLDVISLVTKPTGMALNTTQVLWTPTAQQVGPNTVSVKVTDAVGDTAGQTFSISVQPPTGTIAGMNKGSYLRGSHESSVCYNIAGRRVIEGTAKGLRLSLNKRLIIR